MKIVPPNIDCTKNEINPITDLNAKGLSKYKKDALDDLINQAGGVNDLARMLTLPYMTVRGWSDRGQISKKGAILVEQHASLGVYFKAISLRPDLYK